MNLCCYKGLSKHLNYSKNVNYKSDLSSVGRASDCSCIMISECR